MGLESESPLMRENKRLRIQTIERETNLLFFDMMH